MTSESALPFLIIHCSSYDGEYDPQTLVQSGSGSQLDDSFVNVKSKGWQTAKHPDYPQDLILQLRSGLCRISNIQLLSHHYKIASQVDVYIGITKEHQDDSMYIEFTRLGFVGLDNSDRFQNRELKSIKVQADCEYIRLVIRGCHDNRLNVYKQVGLVGLRILGYHIDQSNQYNQSLNEISFDSDDQSINQQENHSQMFNDPEIEHWIDVLMRAEEEAAQDEDYKEAKLYKELGDKLSGYMRLLVNLENDKQLAVSTKDYDEADKIKADMMEVRITAESLLKQNGIEITNEGTIIPIPIEEENEEVDEVVEGVLSNVPLLSEETESKFANNQHLRESVSHPEKLLDEAIANWTSFDALSASHHLTDDPNSPSLSAHISIKHPINNTLHKPEMTIEEEEEEEEEDEDIVSKVVEEEEEEEEEVEVTDPELIPEPLSEEDRDSCKIPLEVFDKRLVECIISVKVKCRQHGLGQLLELIQQKTEAIKEKREKASLKFIHASMIMIQSAITDSRESIFNLIMQTWKDLCELCKVASVQKNDSVFQWTERAFSGLLTRTGDSNPGIKSSASQMVLELIQQYTRAPHDLMPFILGKKDRATRNAKEAKTRLELVTMVTENRLIPLWNKQTTYLDDFMKFIHTYLEKYPSGEIRQLVINLLVVVSQTITIEQMKPYLDQQTLKTLKEKQAKPKSMKQKSGNTTVNELRALAAKTNISNTSKKTKTKSQVAAVEKTDASKKTKSKKVAQETNNTEEAVTEEKTNVCIFCDEENPKFNEDTLISHYYNHCLVLTNCPMCQIILEVSTLRDHLAEDCERKHLVKECTRCRHPVPVEQWLQHSLKKTCTATAQDQSRCPYCQKDMTHSTEGDWKAHLMSECTKNPRRKTK